MSVIVNVHEAKTHLSKLLNRIKNGEEIIIAKAGKPVARLLPVRKKTAKRTPGSAAGKVKITDDFYKPLPEDVLDSFK